MLSVVELAYCCIFTNNSFRKISYQITYGQSYEYKNLRIQNMGVYWIDPHIAKKLILQ